MESFAALLGVYWLPPEPDDPNSAPALERGTKPLASWHGRRVAVGIAAAAALLAVVSAGMSGPPR
jgi:hypothetical protein